MLITFGERLAEQRAKLGFSQLEICELTSVHRRTQYQYETGKSFPDTRYLAHLMNHGFDVIYLLSGQEAPRSEVIDDHFLRLVLVAVEETSARQPIPLDVAKKASVAALLFQICVASKIIDDNILIRLIKLAQHPAA